MSGKPRRVGLVWISRSLLLAIALRVLFLPTSKIDRIFGRRATPLAIRSSDVSAVQNILAKLPLSFEENRGQTDPSVKFLARTSTGSVFLTEDEVVMVLGNESHHAVVRMEPVGREDSPEIQGLEELPTKSTYFSGSDPANGTRIFRTTRE